jgi:anti-anti-sigma factor
MPAEPFDDPCPPDPESAQHLKTDVRRLPTAVVCTLVGDLDPETAAIAATALQQALDRTEPGRRLLADLSEIAFCSSAALNVLLTVRRDAVARQVPFALVAPSRRTARLMEITGADRVFTVYPTLAEALQEMP